MIRGGHSKRRTKSRLRQTKKTGTAKEKAVNIVSSKEDITAYLSIEKKIFALHEGSSLPEVSVPSPDDAALPKPSLCSLSAKETEHIELTNNMFLPSSKKLGNKTLPNKPVPLNCDQNRLVITNGENGYKCLTVVMSCAPLVKQRTRKIESQNRNHQLTEYFPVRRSNRKTYCNVKKEKHEMVEDAILSAREDDFEIKEFPLKGRGIVTRRNLKRGDFVLEYAGELIDMNEAKKRETLYAAKEDTGCYMYYFNHENKQYCVDATKESGRLGRLVNHSKKGNLKTQSFLIKNSPHLILVARRDIPAGEELLYDYGDRSKKSLESHPWLAL